MLPFCKLLLLMFQQSLHTMIVCLYRLVLPSLHTCEPRDMVYNYIEALLQTTAYKGSLLVIELYSRSGMVLQWLFNGTKAPPKA